ncbi:MAG: hypothetical protein ABIG10_01605 [bacterium]
MEGITLIIIYGLNCLTKTNEFPPLDSKEAEVYRILQHDINSIGRNAETHFSATTDFLQKISLKIKIDVVIYYIKHQQADKTRKKLTEAGNRIKSMLKNFCISEAKKGMEIVISFTYAEGRYFLTNPYCFISSNEIKNPKPSD